VVGERRVRVGGMDERFKVDVVLAVVVGLLLLGIVAVVALAVVELIRAARSARSGAHLGHH
jgi:nitrogen fixation/metabolism regulation signal transduction histidine kinase